MSALRILVITHVSHERLGSFEPVFNKAGLSVVPLDAASTERWPKASSFDGLVVMGGPMGVYEQSKYPFLKKEIQLIQETLKAKKPILGVCLGSQLLAAALGAKVAKNPAKEIGWYPLMREPGADGDSLCGVFGQTETVFQWHGDTFNLPKGAAQLFSSPLCQQQGFRYGANAYGLQFHVEVNEAMIRAWLQNAGNKKELAALKGQIDPAVIKAQTPQHIDRLSWLAGRVAKGFCSLFESESSKPFRRSAHARQ